MNLTKELLKITTFLGLIFGVVALVPYTIFYVLVALFLLSSICSILYYRKLTKFELTDYKTTMITGGVLGFASFVGFIVVFIPCVLVLSFIFKSYYNYGIPYLLNFQAIWLFILIIIVVAIVCASTNAVSLMALQYFDILRKGK
ncbi:MAG: hypothetical protein E7Z91_03010 [Cyanobacteria bacterium SIG30]|nr:hypothetical protein [Cyanobacteria bacterium SIG30]